MKKIVLMVSMLIIAMLVVSACSPAKEQQEQQVPAEPAAPSEPANEPAPEETTTPELPVQKPAESETTSTNAEVKILGKDGFNVAELTKSVGDKVVFGNDAEKSTVLLVKSTSGTKTSPLLKTGDTWEYAVEKDGVHEFWTVGFGVRGKIMVGGDSMPAKDTMDDKEMADKEQK